MYRVHAIVPLARLRATRCLSASPRDVGGAPASKRVTLQSLKAKYEAGGRISVLTAYDSCMAEAMNDCVDSILVGDSVGMVALGFKSTLPVSLDAMVHHAAAVSRSAPRPFLVGDLPFGSYTTADLALRSAVRMVQEGGMHAVKLEGGRTQAAKVAAIVREGIPCVGHVGLTPQTSPLTAGYPLQGKTAEEAARIVDGAFAVRDAGACAVVLEKMPFEVARYITDALGVPTIGIGAGPHCSGQVLVSHDLLGLFPSMVPRFAKRYADLLTPMRAAFESYAAEVETGMFPAGADAASFAAAAASAVPTTAADAEPRYYYRMAPQELRRFEALMVPHALPQGVNAAAAVAAVSKSRPVAVRRKSRPGGGRRPFGARWFHTAIATAAVAACSSGAATAAISFHLKGAPHECAAASTSSSADAQANSSTLRVAVVGTGAIGSLLCALLSAQSSTAAASAVDVTMFSCQAGARARLLRQGGVRVQLLSQEGGSQKKEGHPPFTRVLPLPHLRSFAQLRFILRKSDAQPLRWPALLCAERDAFACTADEGPLVGGAATAGEDEDSAALALMGSHVGAYDVVLLATSATACVSAAAGAMLLVRPPPPPLPPPHTAAASKARPGGLIIPLFNGGFTLEYLARLLQTVSSSSSRRGCADGDGEGARGGLGPVFAARAQMLGLGDLARRVAHPAQWPRIAGAAAGATTADGGAAMVHFPLSDADGDCGFGGISAVQVPSHRASQVEFLDRLSCHLSRLHPDQLVYGIATYGACASPAAACEGQPEGLTHPPPLHIRQTGAGAIVLAPRAESPEAANGRPDGGLTLIPVADVARALSAGGVTTLLCRPGSVEALRWSKLCVNAVLNPAAALLGLPNGAVPHALGRVYPAAGSVLAAEVSAAAAVHGVNAADVAALPHIAGTPAATMLLASSHSGAPLTAAHVTALVSQAAAATAGNTCSTLAALRAGRLTETRLVSGWVARALQPQQRQHAAVCVVVEAQERLLRCGDRGAYSREAVEVDVAVASANGSPL